ncbi:MAG: membrane protein insertion efficiency factor YidD [Chloroflexi bacterium]|nr:membrane protein insertion efficiency factor YidD [Chloroflexota bacterium]
MKRLVLLAIWFYQIALSPLIPSSCRYAPSCSHYSQAAVEKYGVVKGGWIGLKRLARCHPWGSQGFDPVP